MGQDSKGTRIAEDFPAIAARLRELGGRSGQATPRVECGVCDDRGWFWSGAALDWRRCPRCGLSQPHAKPPPRR